VGVPHGVRGAMVVVNNGRGDSYPLDPAEFFGNQGTIAETLLEQLLWCRKPDMAVLPQEQPAGPTRGHHRVGCRKAAAESFLLAFLSFNIESNAVPMVAGWKHAGLPVVARWQIVGLGVGR